mgnify:CR=1 FL=1
MLGAQGGVPMLGVYEVDGIKVFDITGAGKAREEGCDGYLETFLAVLAFKRSANELGIARADIHPERVRLTWADGQKQVQPESIVRMVLAHKDSVRLQPPSTIEIAMPAEGTRAAALESVRAMLAMLAKA